MSKREGLAKKLGYIKSLGVLRGDDAKKVDRFMSARPTYTVGVNPNRSYLYHVVGFAS
jgi:hypothetical protein